MRASVPEAAPEIKEALSNSSSIESVAPAARAIEPAPAAPASNSSAATTSDSVSSTAEAAEVATATEAAPEVSALAEAAAAPEITISAMDNATYYGILGLFIFFLLSTIVVFARRAKVESSAPKKALLFGGAGLGVLAISAFASKSLFADFLNQTLEAYPIWLKPVFWLAIAPLLVMTIPYLVTESPKAHKFFVKCAAKATGAFALLSVGGFFRNERCDFSSICHRGNRFGCRIHTSAC